MGDSFGLGLGRWVNVWLCISKICGVEEVGACSEFHPRGVESLRLDGQKRPSFVCLIMLKTRVLKIIDYRTWSINLIS